MYGGGSSSLPSVSSTVIEGTDSPTLAGSLTGVLASEDPDGSSRNSLEEGNMASGSVYGSLQRNQQWELLWQIILRGSVVLETPADDLGYLSPPRLLLFSPRLATSAHRSSRDRTRAKKIMTDTMNSVRRPRNTVPGSPGVSPCEKSFRVQRNSPRFPGGSKRSGIRACFARGDADTPGRTVRRVRVRASEQVVPVTEVCVSQRR